MWSFVPINSKYLLIHSQLLNNAATWYTIGVFSLFFFSLFSLWLLPLSHGGLSTNIYFSRGGRTKPPAIAFLTPRT